MRENVKFAAIAYYSLGKHLEGKGNNASKVKEMKKARTYTHILLCPNLMR